MILRKPYVITIVGAESSGKTILATSLAKYFNALYVSEYARHYLTRLGRPYTIEDLKIIAERDLQNISNTLALNADIEESRPDENLKKSIDAKKFHQIKLLIEETLALPSKLSIADSEPGLVVIDGGMLTMRLWAWIKYKQRIEIVESALENDITDLYLLCRPLRIWEADPLREAPEMVDRCWIYNQYLNELIQHKRCFEIIDLRDEG
jgi:nicotinamide riboside kinase